MIGDDRCRGVLSLMLSLSHDDSWVKKMKELGVEMWWRSTVIRIMLYTLVVCALSFR